MSTRMHPKIRGDMSMSIRFRVQTEIHTEYARLELTAGTAGKERMRTLRHGKTDGQDGFVLLRTLVFTAVMLLICCGMMSSAASLIKRVAVLEESVLALIDARNGRVEDALD